MVRWIRSLLVLLFSTSVAVPLIAQPFVPSQFTLQSLTLNPAAAGAQNALYVNALVRKQWIQVDGAPSSTTICMDAPVRKKKLGVGVMINSDRISVFNQSGINLIGAYRIHFNDEKNIAFGMQAGAQSYRASYDQLESRIAGDPSLSEGMYSVLRPSLAAGIRYSSSSFEAGISAPSFSGSLASSSLKEKFPFHNYYCVTAAKLITVSHDVKLKPALLTLYSKNAVLTTHANISLLFRELGSVGATYRSNKTCSFLLYLKPSPQLRLGYAFDPAGKKYSVFGGSHEVMVAWLFLFQHSTFERSGF